MSDPGISTVAQQVIAAKLTYLGPGKLGRLERALADVLRRGVAGDIVEMGVALGGSGVVMALQASRAGRAFHGFDVFGMIPPPTSAKDDDKSRERYKVISEGRSVGIGGEPYYGYQDGLFDEVCRAFARHGTPVDGSRVALHKGLFQETWTNYPSPSIAFAHIDCDWYDPVKFCLNSISARLSGGGVIVVDDYHDYGGCRSATNEFLEIHNNFEFIDGENVILKMM